MNNPQSKMYRFVFLIVLLGLTMETTAEEEQPSSSKCTLANPFHCKKREHMLDCQQFHIEGIYKSRATRLKNETRIFSFNAVSLKLNERNFDGQCILHKRILKGHSEDCYINIKSQESIQRLKQVAPYKCLCTFPDLQADSSLICKNKTIAEVRKKVRHVDSKERTDWKCELYISPIPNKKEIRIHAESCKEEDNKEFDSLYARLLQCEDNNCSKENDLLRVAYSEPNVKNHSADIIFSNVTPGNYLLKMRPVPVNKYYDISAVIKLDHSENEWNSVMK